MDSDRLKFPKIRDRLELVQKQSMNTQAQKALHAGKIIGKVILVTLAGGGILVAGAIAPNLFVAIQKLLDQLSSSHAWMRDEKRRQKKVLDAFTHLRRRGLVQMEYRGKQLYISLTSEGKKEAGRYQIDTLQIERKKRKGNTWHLVFFDIKEKVRMKRDALRGKLKELGFYQVQKSVWLHAFPCEREISLLKNFFGLTERECVCFEVRSLPAMIRTEAEAFFDV